jgi:hypothetical protein
MIHSCANGTSAIAIAAAAEIIELIEGRRLGSGAEHVGSTAVPNLVDGTGTGSVYAQGALRADREGGVAVLHDGGSTIRLDRTASASVLTSARSSGPAMIQAYRARSAARKRSSSALGWTQPLRTWAERR